MRKLPGMKLIIGFGILLIMVLSLVPAIAQAKAGDEDELSAPIVSKAGDEDEIADPSTGIVASAGDEDEIYGDEDEVADTASIYLQGGEGQESGEAGNLAGSGRALSLVAFILLLLVVVAVIRASSLRYRHTESRN